MRGSFNGVFDDAFDMCFCNGFVAVCGGVVGDAFFGCGINGAVGEDFDGILEVLFSADEPTSLSECHDIISVRICVTGTSGQ
jgi:hypothetical protein